MSFHPFSAFSLHPQTLPIATNLLARPANIPTMYLLLLFDAGLQVQCGVFCAIVPVSAVHALCQLLVPHVLYDVPPLLPCATAPLVSPLGAHFVMLLAGVLQTIRVTSLTGGLPLTAVPLSFVLIISMLREGIEDYSRYKSDLEVHARAATAYRRFTHIDDLHTVRARD